jgi:hypothetical protein
MLHQPTRPHACLLFLAGVLAVRPVQAQVTLTCDRNPVPSRVACVLTAAHADGQPRDWRWRIPGRPGYEALLEPAGAGRVQFNTPVVYVDTDLTFEVEDAGDPKSRQSLVLTLKPNGKGDDRFLMTRTFPSAFTPSLIPFQGRPDLAQKVSYEPQEHSPVGCIAFCDDAAMGALDRCWLVARGQGLEAFKVAGDRVPLAAFPEPLALGRVTAMAALPPGAGALPKGAPRVVFEEDDGRNHVIYALQPDGDKRPLCRMVEHRSVLGLVLDRKGMTYVLYYKE